MENTSAIDISLRPFQAEDLQEVVNLHQKAFDYTFNSKLGLAHMTRLYLSMFQDPNSIVMVALQNRILAGVATATIDPVKFKKRFKGELDVFQTLSLAFRLLRHPSILFETLHERPVVFHKKIVKGCLTAIAVDSECRQKGIGRVLVAAIEEFFRKNGDSHFYLMTRAVNTGSRKFYEHLGFVELEQRGKDIVLLKEIDH